MPSPDRTEPRLDRHDYMALGGGPLAEDPHGLLRLKLEDDKLPASGFTGEELGVIRDQLAALQASIKVERRPELSPGELVTEARRRLRRLSVPAVTEAA